MSERIVSLHAGYDNADHFVDGYVARPAAGGVRPAVVLISGMSGLNWFQRQITRTFAEAGFVTLSPDLFDGAHPEGRTPALLQKNSLDIDRAVGDVTSGARFLRDLPWVESDARVGVVGFCLGGGLALLSLGRTDAFGAGVIYYHSLFPDPQELEGIDAKLLCHYGTADHSTPREEVDAFTATLDRYEKRYEVAFYEGAGHSFLNPGNNPSPAQQRAREESLERTFAFLREELTGGEDSVTP
ncbi:MAG: dienelactone hydrolase family protein [Chloroflexi bacterium]|nr:dienelactone hydrolase family protein [Chloroflexota bacterium]